MQPTDISRLTFFIEWERRELSSATLPIGSEQRESIYVYESQNYKTKNNF